MNTKASIERIIEAMRRVAAGENLHEPAYADVTGLCRIACRQCCTEAKGDEAFEVFENALLSFPEGRAISRDYAEPGSLWEGERGQRRRAVAGTIADILQEGLDKGPEIL